MQFTNSEFAITCLSNQGHNRNVRSGHDGKRWDLRPMIDYLVDQAEILGRLCRHKKSRIHAVEAEAAASDAERAENDAKIVFAFSDFCEKTTTRSDCFYDESVLPHPKEAIISAIEREIVRAPFQAHVEWLQSARLFLWNFLTGVGAEPVSFKGTSQLPRGNTPADREALRRIVASSEYQRDLDRSSHLTAIAEKQDKEVEERIDNALRIRSARLAGLSETDRTALDEQERRFEEFSKSRPS